ncbi:MAG: site-specific integrase [Candidatus Marinimicrobia bacterium]|nr:site-specific integrase [Candidatus Neomarinimicrobiota bacterium]
MIAFTRLSTSDFGLIIGSFFGLLAAQRISYVFRSNEPNWSDSTHAVHLIAKGVDIYQVSKLLRHEDVSTTQKYYADVIDRDQEEAVRKIEYLF